MRLGFMAIALTVLTAPAIHAQERTRVLNGYSFLPSGLIEDPFAVSYFRNSTGAGVAFDLETPFVDFDGDTLGALVGNVGFLSLDFGWQQRFGGWFAARVALGAVGRVGIDRQSALAQGVTALARWSVGATAQVFRSRNFVFSTTVDFSQSGIVGLDPFGFARSVAEEGIETDSSLLRSTNSRGGKLGLRAAWAPADWIGLSGAIEGGLTKLTDDDSNSRVGGGVSIGIDFANAVSFPLGVLLSAESEGFNPNGPDLSNRATGVGLGVFYTGWSDFSVGLETSWRNLKRREDDTTFSAFLAALNLQYFY